MISSRQVAWPAGMSRPMRADFLGAHRRANQTRVMKQDLLHADLMVEFILPADKDVREKYSPGHNGI